MKQRALVIVGADEACISPSHMRALEHDLPGLDIRHVDGVGDVFGPFGRPVGLLLVESSLLDELRDALPEIGRRHPRAGVTLIQEDDRHPVTIEAIRSMPGEVGLLPMNLKLDVWLAAIRLMLAGGQYVPLALLRGAGPAPTGGPGGFGGPDGDDGPAGEGAEASASASAWAGVLTPREEQILEMVSRGLQNKIIASTLGLSEHTVKLHLHKIITKLGVRNRTEAAITYIARRRSPPGGGGRPADAPPPA